MLFRDDCGDALPLFVYGTLRPGQPNYAAYLRGHTRHEEAARLEGINLYTLFNYPLAVRGERVLIGDVLTLDPRLYCDLLAEIDALEGYDPAESDRLFTREVCTVTTESGQVVRAWFYLGNPAYLDQLDHTLIEHGDWVRFHEERMRQARQAGRRQDLPPGQDAAKSSPNPH
ncbi:MAG: gamma-glutamylcyclotransferase, partial [Anaerolineae bacterium]|nr:gamma-glutamylcyclotransferase [Anaerolineae bacterium]